MIVDLQKRILNLGKNNTKNFKKKEIFMSENIFCILNN